jgi:hypothetical protein
MSALGRKLTLRLIRPMSALPPKADMVLVSLWKLNNFCNLMLTARTFIRAPIIAGFVGEEAHERHPGAAPGTIRTHNNNSWRISENRRHQSLSTYNRSTGTHRSLI